MLSNVRVLVKQIRSLLRQDKSLLQLALRNRSFLLDGISKLPMEEFGVLNSINVLKHNVSHSSIFISPAILSVIISF